MFPRTIFVKQLCKYTNQTQSVDCCTNCISTLTCNDMYLNLCSLKPFLQAIQGVPKKTEPT